MKANQSEMNARKAALSGSQMVETEEDDLVKFLVIDQICKCYNTLNCTMSVLNIMTITLTAL